jgi:hypothetical protein
MTTGAIASPWFATASSNSVRRSSLASCHGVESSYRIRCSPTTAFSQASSMPTISATSQSRSVTPAAIAGCHLERQREGIRLSSALRRVPGPPRIALPGCRRASGSERIGLSKGRSRQGSCSTRSCLSTAHFHSDLEKPDFRFFTSKEGFHFMTALGVEPRLAPGSRAPCPFSVSLRSNPTLRSGRRFILSSENEPYSSP